MKNLEKPDVIKEKNGTANNSQQELTAGELSQAKGGWGPKGTVCPYGVTDVSKCGRTSTNCENASREGREYYCSFFDDSIGSKWMNYQG